MPFGSTRKNAWFMVAVVCVSLSCVSSVIGQVLFNSKEIKALIALQNKMIDQHREMLGVIHRIEAHYLDGQAK